MRILLTVDPEIPVPPKLYGGIERIVADLAAALIARGHEIALIAHPDSQADAGWQLFRWPGRRSQTLIDTIANTNALRRVVRAFQPALIHSFSRLLYLIPFMPAAIPKIMSYQRPPSLRTVGWASRIAGETLAFTGCSQWISQRGKSAGGVWSTIHNFVDTSRFTYSPAVPADAPLVFLSRVQAIKGAHIAIEACRKAGRRLIIAGNHADDDSSDGRYWRDEIGPQIGVGGVEYVGAVDDKQKNDLLGKAAAMIVPVQWEEPFGIVFAESLACGTPVISCPRGALPEIIRDGKEGFLVNSVEDAAAAIQKVNMLSRSACRARAEEEFSSEIATARYEALYQQHVGAIARPTLR